jgi:hypothetical protein
MMLLAMRPLSAFRLPTAAFLLLSLSVSTHAAGNKPDSDTPSGRYTLKVWTSGGAAVSTAVVVDAYGVVVATLPANVSWRHYHPFEVRGRRVFWLAGEGRQLWVMDRYSGKGEKLVDWEDFRASPSGDKVMSVAGGQLTLFDVRARSAAAIETDSPAGPALHPALLASGESWSSDGSRFWFGAADERGQVHRLAVYEGGKAAWLAGTSAVGREFALEPDRGWLATTDYDRSDASPRAYLKVTELLSGKDAVLVVTGTNDYRPYWDGGYLNYSILGKPFRLSRRQIGKKLK